MSSHDTKERTIDQERHPFRGVRKLRRRHVCYSVDPWRGPVRSVSSRTDYDVELNACGTWTGYGVDG